MKKPVLVRLYPKNFPLLYQMAQAGILVLYRPPVITFYKESADVKR